MLRMEIVRPKEVCMKNLYNTVFIVDIAPGTDDVDQIVEQVKSLIIGNGGNIKNEKHWGKKRLAYEIDKKQYGYYVELEYVSESKNNIPKSLESDFRLNERILRYLTYLVDKHELKQREKVAKEDRKSVEGGE